MKAAQAAYQRRPGLLCRSSRRLGGNEIRDGRRRKTSQRRRQRPCSSPPKLALAFPVPTRPAPPLGAHILPAGQAPGWGIYSPARWAAGHRAGVLHTLRTKWLGWDSSCAGLGRGALVAGLADSAGPYTHDKTAKGLFERAWYIHGRDDYKMECSRFTNTRIRRCTPYST